jgi:hypothetical protein
MYAAPATKLYVFVVVVVQEYLKYCHAKEQYTISVTYFMQKRYNIRARSRQPVTV